MGAFTKASYGVLTLNSASTYQGTTTVAGGDLVVGITNAIPNTALAFTGTSRLLLITNGVSLEVGSLTETGSTNSKIWLYNSSVLTINQESTGSFSSVITSNGEGSIVKNGAATLTLSGVNTYLGLTTVSAGSLTYGINNAISTGAVTVNGSTAILALGSYTDSVGAVTLTAGSITGSGTLTSTSASGFTVNPTTGVSVSASPILAGSVSLTKSGAGTLTLSGANTYTGATIINLGTLIISNAGSLGAGTYYGALDINSGTFRYNSSVSQILLGTIIGTIGILEDPTNKISYTL